MTTRDPLRPDLDTAAQAWLQDDPDEVTARELRTLLAAARSGDVDAISELEDAFAGDLQFGTAGLRGKLGPGPHRMNRAVVARAAAGLAHRLRKGGRGGSIVIGYDARHRSFDFARDTAEIVQAAGFTALLLPSALPTPVLAFAIRHLGAVAGVMVTASHNPAQDNGYKVYLGDGTQIVSPIDSEISAAIARVGPVSRIARSGGWQTLGSDVLAAYIEACSELVLQGGARDVTVAYTPLHGVGGATMLKALARAGFSAPHVVPEQFEPDPQFPTVAFPNPEEPGAMDRVIALGRAHGVDVVIANDPDADRCAAAVPTPDGDYRMLRGDEVGALLGWWLAERARRRGSPLDGVYANSIVSSSLLAAMARTYGLRHVETLTGFKWIGRIPGLVFGYEEALGYCVDPHHVGDKDGISAALLLVELVATLRAAGRSVHDVLDDLAGRYGVHATDQLSVRVPDPEVLTATMGRLRRDRPTSLAGVAVTSFEDLADGRNGLPGTDALRLWLADGSRVVVRPSGTEPKLKCYLEVVVAVGDGDLAATQHEASQRLAALRVELAARIGVASS